MYMCVHKYLDFHALQRPETECVVDEALTLTYAQMKVCVDNLSARLHELNLQAGDRIAVLGKNSAQHLMIYLACSKLGVVPCGLNYRLMPDEWSYIVNNAEVKVIFADEEFVPALGSLAKDLPVQIILDEQGEYAGFHAWIDDAPAHQNPGHQGKPEDVLFQMYTSGTTGRPKGALLTHKNVVTNAFMIPASVGIAAEPGNRALVIAPMFHAAGLVSCIANMVLGATNVIHREYDPVRMVEALSKDNISATTAIPIMLQFSIACVPDIRDYDFSNLRVISYGASPISAPLLKEAMEIFQCDFAQCYGQTEATAVLTCLTPQDHKRALAEKPELLTSCGRPVLATEIRVVDDQGNDVPVGEMGEIIAKGAQVMSGYWKRPDATAETLKDGWLYTGDAGSMDEEGYLYIQDRIKDLIISGGENIYPAEVENLLLSHPDIQEAAVVAIPDNKWGEVPLAVIVSAKTPSLSIEDIQAFCNPKLAGFKVPKYLRIVDALPRNPTGKILKKELRDQYHDTFVSP